MDDDFQSPELLLEALQHELARLGSRITARRPEGAPHPWIADVLLDGHVVTEACGITLRSDGIGVYVLRRGVQLMGQSYPPALAAKALHGLLLEQLDMRGMHARYPELHISKHSVAHEEGPAAFVEAAWRSYLAWRPEPTSRHPARLVLPAIAAASAVPGLRQLYPYTSHSTLRLSHCTGYPYTPGLPVIRPIDTGRAGPDPVIPDHFRVFFERGSSEETLGEGGAAEVAQIAAAHLPADCGPAVHGTGYDYLGLPDPRLNVEDRSS